MIDIFRSSTIENKTKKKQNPKIICNSITTEEENKSNESARELEQKKGNEQMKKHIKEGKYVCVVMDKR